MPNTDTDAFAPSTGVVATVPQAVNLANLPRGAAWLMAEAALLDAEAEKYTRYSPPNMALANAAQQLRSSVGHVLQGGHEKVTA
jgi:hypothetical protein